MPYWFDGNNLIGQSAAAARANPRARKDFLSTLSRYQKSGGGRFLVYFDGDDPDRSVPPRGVSVRYSAPLSADETILRRLKEIRLPSEVIVVTNDRNLTVRCREARARVIRWDEFTTRMRARSASAAFPDGETEKVDVEDWISYFGLDENST